MAKIIGPLMSLEAHGTIGSRLTFSSRKTGQQVRFQNKQVDVKSVAQEAQREDFLEAVADWNALSETEKQEFEDRSQDLKLNMTGYNLYILEHITGGIVVGNKIQSSDGKTYIITNDDDTIEMIQNEIKTLEMHDSGIFDLTKQSGCSVYQSSAQNIPNQAVTKVEFDSKNYDIQNEFDSETNSRFTATKPGKYLVVGAVGLDDLNDGDLFLTMIYKNGSLIARGITKASSAAQVMALTSSKIITLDANDYIELKIYHNEGTTQPTDPHQYYTYLTIAKIA